MLPLYTCGYGCYGLPLIAHIIHKWKGKLFMSILFLGDSITDSDHCFTKDNLGNGYVKYLSRALEDSVTNGGTDGFTFPQMLQKWQRTYRSSVYEMAVIAGGINEAGVIMHTGLDDGQAKDYICQSMAALTQLVLELHENGTGRILVVEPFIFPVPAHRILWTPWVEEIGKQMNRTIRILSGTDNKSVDSDTLKILSVQEPLDELAQREGLDAVTKDGIHLTDLGHRMLADTLLPYLQ